MSGGAGAAMTYMCGSFCVPAEKCATVDLASATLTDAARAMDAHKCSSVVVLDATHPRRAVAIITKTDLVKWAFLDGKAPTAAVRECVTMKASDLLTVARSANKSDASEIFKKRGVHHLVVVEDGADADAKPYVGIVSALDVAHEYALDAKAMPYSRDALRAMYR
mmetsp:Transcript_24072/g.58720  ORF Transcript_24072/g.58720 Transcript_24072/m.58720 type:complete len:165 (-) Transcript_24072:283-777(-)